MSSPAPETRSLPLVGAELRVTRSDDGKAILTGYAAVFDSWSEDLGGFREVIRPGAFDRALAAGVDCRFLVNHDPSLLMGRTRSGTLRLNTDARGLHFECSFPASDLADHYALVVDRGDLDGCSFRFYCRRDAWDYSEDQIRRELLDVDFDDVCLATYPAYTDTTAAVRSLDEHRRSQPRPTPRRDRAARLLRLAEAE